MGPTKYMRAFEEKIRVPHFELSELWEDEGVFFTEKGYFGRAPANDIKKGHLVVIIGGAFVPYILENHKGHCVLVSHAYVEGIMNWKHLPDGMGVETIELR